MKYISTIAALLFGLSACAPVSRVPNIDDKLAAAEAEKQMEIAFREEIKLKNRLNDISWPIVYANADLCKERMVLGSGFNFDSKENMPQERVSAFGKIYGNSSQPIVTAVYNGTPAQKVGLKVGDQIISINGGMVPPGTEGMEFIISKLLTIESSFNLTIRRNETIKELTIIPVKICNYRFAMVNKDEVNAFADGDNVFVHSGMMRFLSQDNELALVMGHELAHNTMGHIAKQSGNQALGIFVGLVISVATGVNVMDLGGSIGRGAYSQEFESEADYVGVYYTARAGFDVVDAANLWRKMAAAHPVAINLGGSTTHPSTAKRFLAIEMAAKEITDKKAAGLPLVPEIAPETENPPPPNNSD